MADKRLTPTANVAAAHVEFAPITPTVTSTVTSVAAVALARSAAGILAARLFHGRGAIECVAAARFHVAHGLVARSDAAESDARARNCSERVARERNVDPSRRGVRARQVRREEAGDASGGDRANSGLGFEIREHRLRTVTPTSSREGERTHLANTWQSAQHARAGASPVHAARRAGGRR